MAKQESIVPLRGTIGEITFYQTKDGFLAKKRNGPDKTATEFAKACAAGTLLRTAFKPLVKKASDRLAVGRLSRILMAVLQSDTTHDKGRREVTSGDLSLLEGFNFNGDAMLHANFFAPIQSTVDRTKGLAILEIGSFSPFKMVKKVPDATHFRISTGAASIDFTDGRYFAAKDESEISLIENPADGIRLTVPIPVVCKDPVFIVMGIEYFQEINGIIYPLKDSRSQAFSIVAVDTD